MTGLQLQYVEIAVTHLYQNVQTVLCFYGDTVVLVSLGPSLLSSIIGILVAHLWHLSRNIQAVLPLCDIVHRYTQTIPSFFQPQANLHFPSFQLLEKGFSFTSLHEFL